MSGYIGWLHREEHRELRQVERELYPTVREMERERDRTSLRPRKNIDGPAALTLAGSATGPDRSDRT